MSYDFSIIIPYYNKRYELDLVLMALACQEYNIERFEIIIVDDGSEQNIEDIIVYYQSTYSLVINYIRRPHTGNRGQLRNIGAEQSKAARLIFLDSDMVAESSMLKAFAAGQMLGSDNFCSFAGSIFAVDTTTSVMNAIREDIKVEYFGGSVAG